MGTQLSDGLVKHLQTTKQEIHEIAEGGNEEELKTASLLGAQYTCAEAIVTCLGELTKEVQKLRQELKDARIDPSLN